MFTSYIRRVGFVEPLAAKYCNGTTVTCSGLSQWGSEELASQGYNAIQILKYYYGDNIEIVSNAPIFPSADSYPGRAVRLGDVGDAVVAVQRSLNEISTNYPSIPAVTVDGIFGENTENSVKTMQSIFNLTPDGVVGLATWYKLVYLYVGIRRLAELNSRGQQFYGIPFEYKNVISIGDRGENVSIIQYMLTSLSEFYYEIPFTDIDGIFGESTQAAVRAFQRIFSLPVNGVITERVWNEIYDAFVGIDREFTSREYTTQLDNVINGDPQKPPYNLKFGDSDYRED